MTIYEKLDSVRGLFENLNEWDMACFLLHHVNYKIVWEYDEKVYRLYRESKNGFICEDFFTSEIDLAVALLKMID